LKSFEKKKKNCSNDLKLATTTKTKVTNHWHSRLGTYPLGYQIDAGRMTNWLLYSNSVMQGGMVKWVLK